MLESSHGERLSQHQIRSRIWSFDPINVLVGANGSGNRTSWSICIFFRSSEQGVWSLTRTPLEALRSCFTLVQKVNHRRLRSKSPSTANERLSVWRFHRPPKYRFFGSMTSVSGTGSGQISHILTTERL